MYPIPVSLKIKCLSTKNHIVIIVFTSQKLICQNVCYSNAFQANVCEDKMSGLSAKCLLVTIPCQNVSPLTPYWSKCHLAPISVTQMPITQQPICQNVTQQNPYLSKCQSAKHLSSKCLSAKQPICQNVSRQNVFRPNVFKPNNCHSSAYQPIAYLSKCQLAKCLSVKNSIGSKFFHLSAYQSIAYLSKCQSAKCFSTKSHGIAFFVDIGPLGVCTHPC